MASSDMASIEPWSFRPSFVDPWFSEALSRDTQILSRAFTKSLSDGTSDFFSAVDGLASDPFSPLFTSPAKPEQAPTPAVSNVSGGSDQEPPTNKRQRRAIPVSATSGKASKRKPRASKRSQTTFITADPANFRQMVQQVTGVRFSGCSDFQAAAGSILKPEPQRAGGRFSGVIIPRGCLPTLDTSAFLLDNDQNSHHQQPQQLEVGAGPAGALSAAGAAVSYASAGDDGLNFDSFSSFPTLESWNTAM